MTISKIHVIAAASLLAVTAFAGSVLAVEATRATAGRATRLDPVAVEVVPVAAAPVIVTTSAPEVLDALVVRPTRPPIVETRSPGRPAPIVPIPR